MASRQIRDVQRTMHLIAGAATIAYVYMTPPAGSLVTVIVRVLVPVIVLTGIGMWQWPKLRAALRAHGVRV